MDFSSDQDGTEFSARRRLGCWRALLIRHKNNCFLNMSLSIKEVRRLRLSCGFSGNETTRVCGVYLARLSHNVPSSCSACKKIIIYCKPSLISPFFSCYAQIAVGILCGKATTVFF